VLTVNDPAASDVAVFVQDTFQQRPPQVAQLRLETANGLPAIEILRVANETHADVIVMSTHGAVAARTMLGSVTARVLRDTVVPVIVTPAADPGPRSLEEWKARLKRVLVPIDLSEWSQQQVSIARGLAEALGSELVFVHVLDPADADARQAAHQRLDRIIRASPSTARPTMALAAGEPAREIARVARERGADLIVMGLHASADARKGMGHVTYAVLCATPTLVVAWPPSHTINALARPA
jgi:universal stress protein A